MVLLGLKKYPVDLTAIVTMFDSGGSSGKLRDEFGILPIGDIRQCLISLADENVLTKLFYYRFGKGSLEGHNLGNLLLMAAQKMTGSLDGAIARISKVFNIKRNRVVPITLEKAIIKVVLNNNEEISEEENIINCQYLSKVGIKKLFLEPEVKTNPKAIFAIKNADLIIIGPGKFYTSLISNFLVKGIVKATYQSPAKKVFICNLMTQTGNTDDFSVRDFVAILEKYLGKDVIDYVIFNTGKLPLGLEKKVKEAFPGAEFINYDKDLLKEKKFIGADVLSRSIRKPNPADMLVKAENKRTMVLHDPHKLARIILSLC